MKMLPIPKRKLPNSVSYRQYKADTGEGSSYETAVTLSNVKVDEQKRFSYTSNGREIVGNAIMFYDLVNSSGLTTLPVNESEVIFNGRTYIIKDTDILRADSDTPHHYEILLK